MPAGKTNSTAGAGGHRCRSGQALSKTAVSFLRDWRGDPCRYARQTFVIRPHRVDRTTLHFVEIPRSVGCALAHLLNAHARDPARELLVHPRSDDPDDRFWGIGYAELTCHGADLLGEIEEAYLAFLARRWGQAQE